MYLSINGSGEPLILIHGFCLTGTCFEKQVSLLSDKFKVIVPDLPGVGASPYSEHFSMEKCADELKHSLDREGIKNAVMIGHSMGGYVTLSFAKKYGSDLKGFGLLHSTANPDNDERKAKRDQAVRVIMENGYEYYISRFIPPLFAETFKDAETIQALIKDGIRTDSKAINAQLMAMKTRPSSIEFMKETDLPVLLLAGRNDSIIPVNDVMNQASLVKKGMTGILEQSAHMGMIEEAESCADWISRFAFSCFQ
jgi:pimeloyl-ACP methyl ester carboxylesterase